MQNVPYGFAVLSSQFLHSLIPINQRVNLVIYLSTKQPRNNQSKYV